MKLTYPGLFPYSCQYRSKNEDGDLISKWDGSTLCNNVPSARADANISVIGLGTPYPWGFTASEIAYLYWRVNWWKGITVGLNASSSAYPIGKDYASSFPGEFTITNSDQTHSGLPPLQKQLICGVSQIGATLNNVTPGYVTGHDVVYGREAQDPGPPPPYEGPILPWWISFYGTGGEYPTGHIGLSHFVDIQLDNGFYDTEKKLYYPQIQFGVSSAASITWRVFVEMGVYIGGDPGYYDLYDTDYYVSGPSKSISYNTDYIPSDPSTTVSIEKFNFLGMEKEIQVAEKSSSGEYPGMGSVEASLSVSGITFDKKNEWVWG